jgi:hypothetical protein
MCQLTYENGKCIVAGACSDQQLEAGLKPQEPVCLTKQAIEELDYLAGDGRWSRSSVIEHAIHQQFQILIDATNRLLEELRARHPEKQTRAGKAGMN